MASFRKVGPVRKFRVPAWQYERDPPLQYFTVRNTEHSFGNTHMLRSFEGCKLSNSNNVFGFCGGREGVVLMEP